VVVAVVVRGQEGEEECSWGTGTSTPHHLHSRLHCNLKTLQTGPSVIPQVANANSLSMHCSDVYLYESSLQPDQFGSLPKLEELKIEFCKIKLLPAGAF